MIERKRNALVLALHGAIVLALTLAALGQYDARPLYTVALAHLVIDAVKIYAARDTVASYLWDQIAHLATLGAVSIYAPNLWATGLWADAPAWVLHAMVLAAGAIYAVRAGGFAVGKLMEPYSDAVPRDSLKDGGRIIGLLERGLIYVLMLGNLAVGIGFLIAAKSVLRFETVRDGEDDHGQNRKMSEYVIIGTLASFGWAISITIGVMALRAALPSL